MSSNRHQTVTKTEHLLEVLRKSCSHIYMQVRRVGIEPTTYSFREILDRARSWFFPLNARQNSVGILLERPKKGNRNRHQSVIQFLGFETFPRSSATCNPQLSVIRVTPLKARKPRLNGGVETRHLVPLAPVSAGVPQERSVQNPPSIYDQPLHQLTPIWRWL